MMITTEEQTRATTHLKRHNPIRNPFNDQAACEGLMFQTQGEALDYVAKQNRQTIWSLIIEDGMAYLVSGFFAVNCFGYFLTETPVYPGYETTLLLSDEDALL